MSASDGLSDHAPVLTAHRAGLVGCRGCGRVWPETTDVCGRCGAPLVPPDRRSLQAVWAWWLAGLIFYIPANLLPMLRKSAGVKTDKLDVFGALDKARPHPVTFGGRCAVLGSADRRGAHGRVGVGALPAQRALMARQPMSVRNCMPSNWMPVRYS